ncbi:MAG: YkgJ family cysteine cluster protein [Dehalococcoidales bacterium]|nr:YkgJ family cysteine cluster protein [Dehalococcoidales bacterium]
MGKASNRKKTAKILRSTDRVRYLEDEEANPWLTALLNAYHIQETGIAVELEEEKKKRRNKLACGRGCGTCCQRPIIPVTEPEIRGIIWYVSTKLPGELREEVKTQVLNRHKSLMCPFCVEGVCSMYPVRPIACRILHVFGEPCRPNEDTYLTRPRDMWSHSRDLGRRTAFALLPLYGITGKNNMEQAFNARFLNDNTRSMLEQPWDKLCGFGQGQ